MRPITRLIMLLGLTVASSAQSPPVGEQPKHASELLPARCVAGLVLRKPGALVRRLHDWLESESATTTGLLERMNENPQFSQAQLMYLGLTAAAGTTGWGLPEKLLVDEVALGAVALGDGRGPGFVLALDVAEPEFLDSILARLHQMAGLIHEGTPDPARTREVNGVRVFAFGDHDRVLECRAGRWLLLANQPELMEEVLTRAGGRPTAAASDSPLAAARRNVAPGACAWAFVDMEMVRQLPNARFPEKLPEAAPAFFFGQTYHALRTGKLAVGWLEDSQGEWRATLRMEGVAALPETHRGLQSAPTPQVNWDAAKLPRYLAETTLNVNWADLFAEREALLTTGGASEALNFSTTLSNIFGGLDFLRDVLPAVGGPTRLVLARQDFHAAEQTPSPQLPAFALIAPLKSEFVPRLTQRLFSASQTAISILNLDNAQKGQPTYLLDVDRQSGVKYLFTEFGEPDAMGAMQMSPAASAGVGKASTAQASSETPKSNMPAEKSLAGVRYNFLPAAAVVEGQYVLATSKPLLLDIINAITAAKAVGPVRTPADIGATLDLNGAALVTILHDNRRELVINQMLEKSSGKTEAERNVDFALDWVAILGGVHAESAFSPGRYEIRMNIRWNAAK